MAPKYRQIHTKTLDSFDFNEMPDDFSRLCWLLLPLILDSEGRGIFNEAWLRSKLFPIREDVKLEDIKSAFEWFTQRGMIIKYEVNGRYYFYVPTWLDHQSGTLKEAKSVLPSPPDQLPTNSRPTPDQLQTNSGTEADADSYADADANTEAEAESYGAAARTQDPEVEPFEILQNAIESVIGLPQGADAVKTINEMVRIGVEVEDIQDAAGWYQLQNKTIRSPNQLLGPAKTAMLKRKQASNVPRVAVGSTGLSGIDKLIQEANHV